MNAADKQRYLALNIKDFTKDLLEIDSEPFLEYNDCYNNNICGLMQTNGQCPFGYSPLGSDFFKTDRLDLYDYISNRTKVRTDYEVKILKAEMEDVCRKYEPYLRCRGDWATKSKIVGEVMAMFPHAPTSPTQPQGGTDEKPHFNKDNEDKATAQFKNLTKGGYLATDTFLDDWLYIYGVNGKKPNTKPLCWLKTQRELAHLVQRIWQNTNNRQWAICSKVFTIQGKEPNTSVMKSDLSKIANMEMDVPKSFSKLDEALNV